MKLVSSNAQLRSEIRSVQTQMKTAIQNHQMIVFKLKDQPVSIKLRVQMCNVQRHIVSLGEKQKKLLAQLRQELEASGIKTEHKPSLKVLQNLRPNPLHNDDEVSPKSINIKKEPEIKSEYVEPSDNIPAPVKPEVVPHSSRRKSKLVATPDLPLTNGHPVVSSSPSLKENTPSSTPSSSPTHVAIPIKPVKTRTPKRDSIPPSSASEESQDSFIHLPADPELRKKLQFMTALSLVTREVLAELQNRRSVRKRQSTANPQFLYGNSIDQKRRKANYLSNSAAGVMPLIASSKEPAKPSPSAVCVSCSSSDGSLSQCSSCGKTFHWNCQYDAAVIAPSEEALKCKSCQQVVSSAHTNGII